MDDLSKMMQKPQQNTPSTHNVTFIFNFLSSVLNICMYTFESYIEKI